MNSIKLLILLRTLDKAELKRFNQFILSPYFNTNPTLREFWQYLKKHAPSFSSKKLMAKEILATDLPIRTSKSLEQQKWKLVKLIGDFLAIEQFQKDKMAQQKRLNTAFYEKDLYEWYLQTTEENITSIEQQKINTETDYLILHQLHHGLYFNQNSKKYQPTPPNLAKSDDYLEHYYWLSKLKHVCEWTSRAVRHKEPLAKDILAFTLPPRFLAYPIFTLYHNTYELFKYSINQDEAKLFEATIKLFEDTIIDIPANDQLILLIYLMNHGIAGTRIKEHYYFQALFRLHDLGIKEKILFWQGQLQPEIMINIVHIGGKLEKFDWAETILEANKNNVATDNTTTFYIYTKANLDFYRHKYFDVVAQLENLKIENWSLEIARRSLQLRSSFECFLQKKHYTSFVENKAKNFKQFLRRKDNLSTSKEKAYLNLINSIQQAIMILKNVSIHKAPLEQLIQKIEKKEPFVEKVWLQNLLQKQLHKIL